jgi:hypothetical protein
MLDSKKMCRLGATFPGSIYRPESIPRLYHTGPTQLLNLYFFLGGLNLYLTNKFKKPKLTEGEKRPSEPKEKRAHLAAHVTFRFLLPRKETPIRSDGAAAHQPPVLRYCISLRKL